MVPGAGVEPARLFSQGILSPQRLSVLDAAIGRMGGALDSLALRKRTLSAVLSDNGAFLLTGLGR